MDWRLTALLVLLAALAAFMAGVLREKRRRAAERASFPEAESRPLEHRGEVAGMPAYSRDDEFLIAPHGIGAGHGDKEDA